MASIYEPIIEQIILGQRVNIPDPEFNMNSFRVAFYRYIKGNLLCKNKVMDYTVEMTDTKIISYTVFVRPVESKKKFEFTVVTK